MADARELRRDHPIGVNAYFGTIAETPTALAQKIFVVLPEFDRSQQWGPCPWTPRLQIINQDLAEPADAAHVAGAAEAAHIVELARNLFPTRGDACLVMFDNRRKPWIVSWWPY